MTNSPVHLLVARPERFTRMQLLARFAVFLALGLLGLSFATLFAIAYLVLPVFAAVRLGASEATPATRAADRDRVAGLLRWLASLSAWVGLCTDRLPTRDPQETVRLTIDEPAATPSPGAALGRIFTGLPSALVLMVLCWFGLFVWVWAALTILIDERVGRGAFNYLVGLQRWSVRLLAYQAGLVDAYPPFSFAETQPSAPAAVAA